MEIRDNKIVIACSGASNTGCYTDEVARKMAKSGDAKMLCMAKIAIGDKALIEKTKQSNAKIIVLDGCPINCVDKIMKTQDFSDFTHINTTSFGITKGKTPLIDEKVEEIINHIKIL